jgi:hypothetical protein
MTIEAARGPFLAHRNSATPTCYRRRSGRNEHVSRETAWRWWERGIPPTTMIDRYRTLHRAKLSEKHHENTE